MSHRSHALVAVLLPTCVGQGLLQQARIGDCQENSSSSFSSAKNKSGKLKSGNALDDLRMRAWKGVSTTRDGGREGGREGGGG